MLTLSLLRHAKSSWANPELDDHERPLTKRGAKAIPAVAKFIRQARGTMVLDDSDAKIVKKYMPYAR